MIQKSTSREIRLAIIVGEKKDNKRSRQGNAIMRFPATAALEKLILTLPEDRGNKRKRTLEEPPSSLLGLDTFDMSCLNQVTETVENDGLSPPLSPPGFPRIEWSSVAIHSEQDICYLSLVAMDTSQSSISFKEEAHSFLERFFAGDTSNTVKDVSSSSGNSTTRRSSPEQTSSSASTAHNGNYNSNKHGRLVRSIALGSRLALLEHPLTSSSINAFVIP